MLTSTAQAIEANALQNKSPTLYESSTTDPADSWVVWAEEGGGGGGTESVAGGGGGTEFAEFNDE